MSGEAYSSKEDFLNKVDQGYSFKTDRQKNTKSPIKLTCFTLCTVLLRKYASCNTHFHGRLIFLNLDYTSNCRRDYHTMRSATWVYFAHIRILVL